MNYYLTSGLDLYWSTIMDVKSLAYIPLASIPSTSAILLDVNESVLVPYPETLSFVRFDIFAAGLPSASAAATSLRIPTMAVSEMMPFIVVGAEHRPVLQLFDFNGKLLCFAKYRKGFISARVDPITAIDIHYSGKMFMVAQSSNISIMANLQ